MTDTKSDPDEIFADLLAECDAQLAAGNSAQSLDSTLRNVSAELLDRLERAKQTLLLLESVWPRPKSQQPRLPEKIDRFRILRELGRGGFGVVYLAHDDELDRAIALKVQRPEAIISRELRQRFLQEAKAAARLRHPHIAGVYEVGSAGWQIWVATEYCEGDSLAAWLRTGPAVGPRAAADFMASLADAVDYSHQEGILHRDLKPSNVLLGRAAARDTRACSELTSYTPKLIDFGLAKVLGSEHLETQHGVLVGTPAYMAPEQANGQVNQIGPATDIYALGAILYELLTGRLVFQGSNTADTLRQIVSNEPVKPRQLRPNLPPDLEAICLKCLQKEPAQRYAAAGDIAADLRRFLAGCPTIARPLTVAQRSRQWARRQPAHAALVAATALGTLAIVTAYLREVELRRDVQSQSEATNRALDGQRRATQMAEAQASRATREAEAANKATQFMTDIFQTSDLIGLADLGFRRADERLKQLNLAEVLRRGSSHVEADLKQDPRVQARLMNTLGNIDRSLGVYDDAETLLRKSLAIRINAAIDPENPDRNRELELAESQFNLAWLLHDVGKYDEAEPLYRQALQLRTAIWGKDNLGVAKTQFNLAWLLADLNESNQAEQLFRQVIQTRRRLLPAGDRDVLLAEIGLTAVLYSQNRESEAITEAASSLPSDQLVRLIGGYHLARQQRQQRKFDPAKNSYQRLLNIARKELPPQHPLLAAVLIDMAGLLKEKGEYPAAEEAVREGLGIVQSVMDGHPKLIEGMTTFAVQLEQRGDFSEAEQLNRDALKISRLRRAKNVNEKANILQSLARLRSLQGDFAEATSLLQESFQVQPDVKSPEWRAGTRQLAGLSQVAGNSFEAEGLYRQLVSASSLPDPVDIQLDLRQCLLDKGDYPAAEKLRNEAAASIEALRSQPDADVTAEPLVDYANKLAKCGEFNRAASCIETVLTLERKKLPPEHPDLGQWLETIARFLLQSLDGAANDGQRSTTLTEIDKSLREAEAIYRSRLGDDHPWLAQNALLRAKMLGASGDWQGALAATNFAKTLLAAHFSADHPWILAARHQRANVRCELGAYLDAEEALREVLALRQKHLPELHTDVFEAQLDLAKTLNRAGNTSAAEAQLQGMLNTLAKRSANGGRRAARIEAVLGASLTAEQAYESAERHLISSHAAFTSIYGGRHTQTREVTENLIKLYRNWNKPDRAAEFQQLLDLPRES